MQVAQATADQRLDAVRSGHRMHAAAAVNAVAVAQISLVGSEPEVELIAQGRVARTGPWLHLPAHRPVPGPADLASWRQLERLIERDGLRAPSLSALAGALRQNAAEVLKTLHRLETLGFVIAVAKNRFFTVRQAAKLAGIAERLAASDGEDGIALTAAVFRDESGISRNLTIEVLEYFDRVGLTRRKGGHRRILRRSSELFGDVSS